MSQIILEIQSLSLEREQQVVLHNVNLSVFKGEVLVIIGESGSGKSSLLRCLNRLEIIRTGRIIFNDVNIQDIPILELRQQIGMVFQKTAPFDGTVADNIRYGVQLRGKTLSQAQVLSLMQKAALEAELINRDAKSLSGGQEQRLAIARALANQPKILLLDEPSSALDPIATHKIEDILLSLRDETGLTLIWVSHSIEQALRIADRVLFLEAGYVVRCDTVANMLDATDGDARVLAFASGKHKKPSKEA